MSIHEHSHAKSHSGEHQADGDSPQAGQAALTHHSHWDERYTNHSWPSEPDPWLVELASGLVPGKALDLGAGPGRNAIWLAQQGWEVTAVDGSQVALDQAAARARAAGVELELVRADLLEFQPISATYELVVVANIHMRSPNREKLFATAARALKPGGHLFVVGHHLEDFGRHGPPDPDMLYTPQRLAAALPKELVQERVERVERSIGDGVGGHPDVAVLAWASAPRSQEGTP
ncbi:MAG: class I SAM-dependent methyltransferase [Actinobacteria bacterium]|nr:class I SAM-dependent methyltransferase [Actinomycetota bacterium]